MSTPIHETKPKFAGWAASTLVAALLLFGEAAGAAISVYMGGADSFSDTCPSDFVWRQADFPTQFLITQEGDSLTIKPQFEYTPGMLMDGPYDAYGTIYADGSFTATSAPDIATYSGVLDAAGGTIHIDNVYTTSGPDGGPCSTLSDHTVTFSVGDGVTPGGLPPDNDPVTTDPTDTDPPPVDDDDLGPATTQLFTICDGEEELWPAAGQFYFCPILQQVFLPVVYVPGAGAFDVTLVPVDGGQGFALMSAQPTCVSSSTPALFNLDSGLLHLPEITVGDIGTFEADLRLSDPISLTFELESVWSCDDAIGCGSAVNVADDDGDDPSDTPPPTTYGEEIDPATAVCGPQVDEQLLAALQRIQSRTENLPSSEIGMYDGTMFLERNGINIDFQVQTQSNADGADICPTESCTASDGQRTVTLCGRCVMSHIPNDILFGFTANRLEVPFSIQLAGAHYAELVSYGGLDPLPSQAAYKMGNDAAQAMSDAGDGFDVTALCDTLADSRLRTGLLSAPTGFSLMAAEQSFLADCAPCPNACTADEVQKDFSTTSWHLDDGTSVSYP